MPQRYRTCVLVVLPLLTVIISVLSLSSCGPAHVIRPPEPTHVIERPPSFAEVRQDIYHAVAPGETLWRISKMYDVDIETLKAINKIKDVCDIEIGEKLLIPKAAPRRNVITMYPNKNWKYIVLHHSATGKGNSMEFNRSHINKGWQGVGYHFIIDNGTSGKDDGQIETAPRWLEQQPGAHCKAGGMNDVGIGICLVGNFSQEKVSDRQMDSLVYLVTELRQYYHIPEKNILGHSQVPGARTECPGKKFPWAVLWKKLAEFVC